MSQLSGVGPFGTTQNQPTLPDLPTQTNLWAQAHIDNPYDFYALKVVYDWDQGTAQMPVNGDDGNPAEIVKVHAASGRKVVLYAARRTGALPSIPPREADTPNQVFAAEHHDNDTSQVLTADGMVITYTFSGWYLYDLLVPLSPSATSAAGDSLQYGQPPYFTGSATQNLLTPQQLDSTITAGGEQLGALYNAWLQSQGGGQLGLVKPPGG